jgi:diguanylate cyclase (GGDEF)-like protein
MDEQYIKLTETKQPLILIVEDTIRNIQVIGSIFKKEDFKIAVTTSSKEALSIVNEINPDIILLDIMMPEMDGYEVCNRLKASDKTKDIPVIFLTAKGDPDSIIKGFNVGAIDYISKPFNRAELLSRVQNHLEIKRSREVIAKIAEERKNLLMELEQKNEELERLAVTDSLTGMYNHKYIIDRLSQEVAKAKRYQIELSIVMFDIDHFKNINDTYGHQVGDDVLFKVTSTIKSRIRETDIAGRFGEEEFLVILPNINLDNSCIVAEKIRACIQDLKWKHDKLQVTISGGVAGFSGENMTELIKKADINLYKAKEGGRNNIVCA